MTSTKEIVKLFLFILQIYFIKLRHVTNKMLKTNNLQSFTFDLPCTSI